MAKRQWKEGTLRARMVPDFRLANPYQRLLGESIQAAGGDVSFSEGYRRGLPITRDLGGLGERPHVLHLHWLNPFIRFEGLFLRWLYGRKTVFDLALVRRSGIGVVWTVHNLVSHEARYPRLEMNTNRRIARVAHEVILHSQSALAAVGEAYRLNAAHAHVIPHGHYCGVYGLPPSCAEARASLGLPQEGTVFLAFGLLRPYKGTEDLLDAWSAFASSPEGRDSSLVIAGDCLDSSYLTLLQKRCAALPRVRLDAGFVPDSRVAPYFAAADVVVTPFRQILTSGSLLLALSFKKPVVARRLPLVEEVLGDADAFTYDPKDEAGLAGALRRAATDDTLRAAMKEAVEGRLAAFGWDQVGRSTLAVYEAARRRGDA